MLNSRSSRSWMISMCSRPRKPQRNPKPSASLLSGSKLKELSLSDSRSIASRSSSYCVLPRWIEIAIDHLLRRLVAGQRFVGGSDRVGDGVADAHVVQVLDRGDDETDLAGADFLDLLRPRHELAQIGDLIQLVGSHEADLLALLQFAVE